MLFGPPRAGRLLLTRPLQNFKVFIEHRLNNRPAIPRAAMLAQPFLRLPWRAAALQTPFTAILVGILQHCQVAPFGCSLACVRNPITAVLAGKLQHCQVTVACSSFTGVLIPMTVLLLCPLQHFHMAFSGCAKADLLKQELRNFLSLRLQELQIPSFGSF